MFLEVHKKTSITQVNQKLTGSYCLGTQGNTCTAVGFSPHTLCETTTESI